MKKNKILDAILDKLKDDYELLFHAAKASHEVATNDENIPDNKYDTLSLEASYLAQGQANRAQEIDAAIKAYKQLQIQSFDSDTPIRITALVLLEDQEETQQYVFIGSIAGGVKIQIDSQEITVVTPESPLGRNLIGAYEGDIIEIEVGRHKKELEIIEVF